MSNYLKVRTWLISLLDFQRDADFNPFTPEVNAEMMELWEKRDTFLVGEERLVTHAFEAVINYRTVEERFTPHCIEKKDDLKRLYQEILRRVRILKEYVENQAVDQQRTPTLVEMVDVALTEGHFELLKGNHSRWYFDKRKVYPRTQMISFLCKEIAGYFLNSGIQVVIGPEKGAIVLACLTALHLSEAYGREVLWVYAKKEADGSFTIPKEYWELFKGKRVLVVEDTLTTGSTARKVVVATRVAGGTVVGVGALFNRKQVTDQDVGDVPKLVVLVNQLLEEWQPPCPLCKKDIPLNTDLGHGGK